MLYGAKTGGDGIGGVSVLASETFDAEGPAKRPSVQVGDPFMEKLLIECTLELFDAGLVAGIQDLGGAGLSCATSELASAGDGGMHVWLDRVPLRDASLAPEEILMSESQERMMAVVEPAHIDDFLATCAKWEVDATVIGEVTDHRSAGHRVARRDDRRRAAANRRPRRSRLPASVRPARGPGRPAGSVRRTTVGLTRPAGGAELKATFLRLVASPNLCDRSWVTDQYDRYVRGNTVLAQPEDAGVIRVDDRTGLGIALALDCNARFARLDPYHGAQLALAEAYRNVAAAGARPIAVTDCLNFGSPEDPDVMWQFAEATRGLADGCRTLGIPVTGGNVSLYNQTAETPILPTPVVGVLGVMADVTRRTPIGFREPGQQIYLLGRTDDELDGSAWAEVEHGHLGGRPPSARPGGGACPGRGAGRGSESGLIGTAHDLSDGGLAQALLESCLRHGIGAQGRAADGRSTRSSRCSPSRRPVRWCPSPTRPRPRFDALCTAHGVPCRPIGVTEGTGEDAQLEVRDTFEVSLRRASTAPGPAPIREAFSDLAVLAVRGDSAAVRRSPG